MREGSALSSRNRLCFQRCCVLGVAAVRVCPEEKSRPLQVAKNCDESNFTVLCLRSEISFSVQSILCPRTLKNNNSEQGNLVGKPTEPREKTARGSGRTGACFSKPGTSDAGHPENQSKLSAKSKLLVHCRSLPAWVPRHRKYEVRSLFMWLTEIPHFPSILSGARAQRN